MVKNLTSRPLTKVQVSLLAQGSKLFSIATILSKRRVCCCHRGSLSQTPPPPMAEELVVEIKSFKHMLPKPNITKDEAKALKHPRQDKDRIILTADKGVALVVLDRRDYVNKAMYLLANRDTFIHK